MAGVVLGAGAIGASSAEAATFQVTNLNDTGAGSLRQAIDDSNAAAGADTITFQSGLSGTINVASEMHANDDLTIDGPGPSVVTLDGGDSTSILRVATGYTTDLSVSGLTLTNGHTTYGNGGAIYAKGSLTLDDVVVSSSYAKSSGGGAWLEGNDLIVTDSRFSGNEAGYTGGGFGADGSRNAGPGPITITGTTVTGNESSYSGGGIALYDSYHQVSIDTSTITNNEITSTSTTSQRDGGGIWFEDTYSGATTVSNSTVSGNSGARGGGGVSFGENFYDTANVVNSTVTGNEAEYGGGIHFNDDYNAQFELDNSTVTGNTAADGGGGIWRGYAVSTYSHPTSALDVSSSVVSANSSTTGGNDFGVSPDATGDLTLGNVLAGDVSGVTYTADPAGSNIIGADPKLGPLANNGGPTQTMLPDAASPLVNAGLANGLTKDQRGEARTIDYPGVPNSHGSDGTDIGAAELGIPAPPDNSVTDPYLEIASPQEQGKKKVKVKVVAGAGEDVTGQVWGKIFVGKGNAVMKTAKVPVASGQRVTITVKPKKNKATKRILKALANGRKVTAKLKGKLADAAGNEYQKDLEAELEPKK
ncbi:MAG: choice-of-anchor Q domain-containing protein [Solirubrobacterales bacterium]